MAFLDKNDLQIDNLREYYHDLGECVHLELDKKRTDYNSDLHESINLTTAFFNLAFAGSLVNYQHFSAEKIIYTVDDFYFYPIFDPNAPADYMFNELDQDECAKLCKSWSDDFMIHIFGSEYREAREKYIAKLKKNIDENITENNNENNI